MNNESDHYPHHRLAEVLAEKEALTCQLQDLRENLLRINQSLRESQAHLNRTQSVARVGSWHLDILANHLWWSDETYRIFGVQLGSPQCLDSFTSYVYPADRDHVLDAWRKALNDGAIYDVEHRIVVAGEVRWVRERAEIVWDDEGNPTAGTGTVQDITEQKKTEAMLNAKRARLKALFDGASDGILVADVESRRFVEANPAICSMLGYTRDELLTLGVVDIHPNADLPEILESFERQARHERFISEKVPVLRKDGSVFFVDINVSRLESDGHLYLAGFFRDITISLSTLEQLKIEKERLRLALDTARQDWWDLDVQTGVLKHGPSYGRMLGYEAKESSTQYKRWVDDVHIDDRMNVQAQFDHALNTGEIMKIKYRRKSKSGAWIWFSSVGKVIQSDDQGRPLRLIGIHSDITQWIRKKQEGEDLMLRIEALIQGLVAKPGEDSEVEQETSRWSELAAQLSPRQREILVLVAQGYTSAKIAQQLNISYETVVTHRRNLMNKLGLHTTAELTRFALHAKLVPD